MKVKQAWLKLVLHNKVIKANRTVVSVVPCNDHSIFGRRATDPQEKPRPSSPQRQALPGGSQGVPRSYDPSNKLWICLKGHDRENHNQHYWGWSVDPSQQKWTKHVKKPEWNSNVQESNEMKSKWKKSKCSTSNVQTFLYIYVWLSNTKIVWK